LFKKSGFWQYVFIAFGVFCLAASLARELPLMKWLISWVPMLSYFRFPSLLRLFFILGSVIFSLGALKFFLNDFEREKKKLLLSAIFLIAIAAAILSYAIVKVDFQHLTFAKPHDSIAGLLHGLSLYERILFGGAIQLLMLIIFVLILLRSKSQFSFLKFVVGLFIVDLIISVQTNINFTVADPAVKPIETEAKLDSIIPAGFPIPKRTSMLNAQNEGTGILGVWRNVNDFTKQPATDGFSSFWLNDYILLDNDTLLKKKVLDNPPVYLSAEVFPMKELADHKSRDLIRRKNIYLPDQDYEKIKNTKMLHAPSDTAAFLQFGPNTFRIKVKSSDAQVLTLMQSNYAGWHVKVNGKPSQWMKSNFLFMSVLIPSGEYEVEFYYENNFVKYGFIIALITLLSVMTALILFRVRRSVYK
ncbi:MAG TPA: YfhO family protein, partial [Bacteroidia bacterium]